MLTGDDLKILVKTLPGLETVLARELKELGGRQVKPLKRAVQVRGDIGFVYKCNIWLRTALRVLVQLDTSTVRNEGELYRVVKRLPWEQLFDLKRSIAIDATVYSPHFQHSLYVAQKSKDAIADRFRDKTGQRPNVDLRQPDIRINIHISGKQCTVSLDSSGDSLHKRNYRHERHQAPINEVLAAGILKLAGWDGHTNFLDPFCGSGTFLTEAALIAYQIPPGVFRKTFSFQNWGDFDAALFDKILQASLEKERDFEHRIIGMDRSNSSLLKSRANATTALLEDRIELHRADFTKYAGELDLPSSGLIVANPPYDIKLEAEVEQLYKEIGDSLKQQFTGYQAWIFTASPEGAKNIGLKAQQKIPLKNAQLDSQLLHFPLY